MLPNRVLSRIRGTQKAEEVQRLLRLDRYWRREVVEALLARADEVVALDPALGLDLARVANRLTERLPVRLADLVTHARCALAVAYRHLGQLDESARCFAEARQSASEATPRLQAMVARQRALLSMIQGEKDEALSLAHWAVLTDRQLGLSASTSLIIEGIVLFYRGEHRDAVERFAEVLAGENPRQPVYLIAIQNLGFALAEASRTAEEIVRARRILKGVRARIKGLRDTPIRYRVCWAEAILHRRLEEYGPALEALMRARKGFLRMGMAHDFALVSADLATLYLEMNQERAARGVVQQTRKALVGLGDNLLAELFCRATGDELTSWLAELQGRLARPPGSC